MNQLEEPHRKRLHRIEDIRTTRFITFSCDQSRHYLENPGARDRLVRKLQLVHGLLPFDLYEWVIMTNHVHLLLRPRTEDLTVPKILERLKTQYARNELPRVRANGIDAKRFWLPGGGYDRNIFSRDEYMEKAKYIAENPVKAGLVDQIEDWRWSSATWPDRFWDNA